MNVFNCNKNNEVQVQIPPLLVRLLRLADVILMVGLKRSAIYKRIAEGTFPAPVNLGGRAVAWKEHEIQQWINALDRSSNVAHTTVGRQAKQPVISQTGAQ